MPPLGGLFHCTLLCRFAGSFPGALLRLLRSLALGEMGADGLRRMPDGGDGGLQSGGGDLEFLRPVADLVRLAHRDQPAIGPAALLLVVRHPYSPVVLRKSTLQTGGNLPRPLAFGQIRTCGDPRDAAY